MFGPVPTNVPELAPIVILAVGDENGAAGNNHVTFTSAVVELPTANTVGLVQVKVWVNIAAVTLGNTVLDKTVAGIGVWQPLIGSNTTKVHVPGTGVVVHDCELNKLADKGTVAVLVGGINAYCTGPFVLLALAIHKVVVFTGELQPNVKLVLLVTLNVGKAEVVVIFINLILLHPFTLFKVTTVTCPGEQILAILVVPLVTGDGPPGNAEPGAYQEVVIFVVGEVTVLVNVGQVELQLIIAFVALNVLTGTAVF